MNTKLAQLAYRSVRLSRSGWQPVADSLLYIPSAATFACPQLRVRVCFLVRVAMGCTPGQGIKLVVRFCRSGVLWVCVNFSVINYVNGQTYPEF